MNFFLSISLFFLLISLGWKLINIFPVNHRENFSIIYLLSIMSMLITYHFHGGLFPMYILGYASSIILLYEFLITILF